MAPRLPLGMFSTDLTIASVLALVMAVLVAIVWGRYPQLAWSTLWTYRTRPKFPPSGKGIAYIRYPLKPVAATCSHCARASLKGTLSIVPSGFLDDAYGEAYVCVTCGEAYTQGGQTLGYYLHVIRPEPRWPRLGKLIRRLSPWGPDGRIS